MSARTGSRCGVRPAASSAKKTLFFGAMQQSRAKLVLIKGDGLDGVSFTLAGDEHIAGREDAPLLFDEDPFLSPRHANFLYRTGDLIVRGESGEISAYHSDPCILGRGGVCRIR